MNNELVVVLDFGGQFSQLLARRVREQNVYCQVLPYHVDIEKLKALNPKGIILSGGPDSVTEGNSFKPDRRLFEIGVPILGICYGSQLISHMLGGKVIKAPVRENGKHRIFYKNDILFDGVLTDSVCWMSHTDCVETLPEGFSVTASTDSCAVAAFAGKNNIYGVQFHPEVSHTEQGSRIIRNFLYEVCKVSGDWRMDSFANSKIKELTAKLKGKKVLCALSGGVDSAVAAAMVHKACGEGLTCVFVDHGLLRKGEADEVMHAFKDGRGINVIKIDASEIFLSKLKGVTEPEKKRKIIGEEFIRVFERAAKEIGQVDYLVQGTIYPDVIESGAGDSAVIKSHHNVGGLPSVVDFKEIIEPLRDLFKDEVRKVGMELELPESMVMRQPFPGPGLAIRVIGEVTPEKLKTLADSDYIFRDEIFKAGLNKEIWQYFTVLTGNKSVGVSGDSRTYEHTLALRAVNSVDGMTADWAKIPYDVLDKISVRIVNEVKNINRIVYDITSKPPATIEWE